MFYALSTVRCVSCLGVFTLQAHCWGLVLMWGSVSGFMLLRHCGVPHGVPFHQPRVEGALVCMVVAQSRTGPLPRRQQDISTAQVLKLAEYAEQARVVDSICRMPQVSCVHRVWC
jgi:hypothetical protein